MPKTPDIPLSPDQVLDKMAKYCAYQERCVKEVKDKLKTYDIAQEERDKILDYLIDNRFVNDERFVECFVRSKINQNDWGVNKIRYHLIQKGIDKELIDVALEQTKDDSYRQRLIDILTTKAKTVKAASDFEKKRKLAAYAIQKGFEGNLVWEVLKDLAI